ncbi:MAG: Asp23/Gls24 family envelope stress response protein [Actinomycetota bacterium]|nr:Asp23/Gls24 family envelope stress response protein [Actinomycetota bacterium]
MSQQSGSSTDVQQAGANALVTDKGRTSIADSVVLKIAGVAAREVNGVHAMGSGGARAFGALKEKLPGASGQSPTQGVTVEVGERQAAIDIDLVVEYGVSIPDVSQAVRRNVIQRVERMTGLEVTEVNLSVDDVYLGDDDEEEEPEPARVQ